MDRRTWLLGSLGLLAAPLAGGAQPAGKVYRIGFLRRTSPEPAAIEAFRQGLRELGYVEGQNVVIEQRYARGAHERLPGLARELLQLKIDALVVDGTLTVRAAREVVGTTPIVFTVVSDPVGERFATSLARPGGTITGLTQFLLELIPKRLQLLQEVVPTARVGVLYNPPNTPARPLAQLGETARSLGVELRPVEVRSPGSIGNISASPRHAGLATGIQDLRWTSPSSSSRRLRNPARSQHRPTLVALPR